MRNQILIDEVVAGQEWYLGESASNVGTDQPLWRILHIDLGATPEEVKKPILDVDGNKVGVAQAIWDNRTTYTYG